MPVRITTDHHATMPDKHCSRTVGLIKEWEKMKTHRSQEAAARAKSKREGNARLNKTNAGMARMGALLKDDIDQPRQTLQCNSAKVAWISVAAAKIWLRRRQSSMSLMPQNTIGLLSVIQCLSTDLHELYMPLESYQCPLQRGLQSLLEFIKASPPKTLWCLSFHFQYVQ